jgi:hypothetical protein
MEGRVAAKSGFDAFCVFAPFVNGKWAMPEEGPPRGTKRAVARALVTEGDFDGSGVFD